MSTSIMLVSADREMARFLRASLRETPVKVVFETASPKLASEALAANDYGLVVVDLFLPESSGLEAINILKRVREDCNFLLLTRMRTRAVIERAFRYGAQDVLHYPVSTDILCHTILHRLEAQPMISSDEDPAKARTARK